MKWDELYGQEVLNRQIRTERMGRTVCFYDSIHSTNEQAKAAAEKGAADGSLLVADMQTAGKGRRGRTWESPAGTNVYFSLILKPKLAPDKASMLTLVMALAVAKGMEAVFAEGSNAPKPWIKWPNDIVLNGKKVCGILTEMVLQGGKIGCVVIGVGINVNKQDFSPELVDKATDLETECGQKVSRSILIAKILEAFEEYYDIFARQESLAELRENYNEMLVNRSREVCVLDPKGEYRGVAMGITDTGELCVQLPDGRETLVYAGEVSVRGIYGYV